MILKLKLATAAAIVGWLTFSWQAGLLIGFALLVWKPAAAVTKTILVLDHETGEMTVQAADDAAERYLNGK